MPAPDDVEVFPVYATEPPRHSGDMTLYFARPINLYDTPQDQRDLALLAALGFDVLDPNRPEHQAAYGEQGMAYFVGLVAQADGIVFRACPDASIPAGVSMEVQAAIEAGKPVLELPTAILRRTLTTDETRAYLRASGYR